ncbi:ankyrin repeat protein [Biomphalaria pfeifferi]|uniref:Ankyrin repeat protein n=1 Tax=Biomphalaria pfeifferi TaxID=112525 RepID=A0AAD8EZN9_BIOPF|nr:ankyrin repeat protein [Biomphalaria pfeifferi]
MASAESKMVKGLKIIKKKYPHQTKVALMRLRKSPRIVSRKRTTVTSKESVDTEPRSLAEHFLNVITSENNEEALALVTDSPKDLNITQTSLNKALLLACRRGNKFLVQSLLLNDAYVNCTDARENTPLMICAKNGFVDIATVLIRNGANPNCRNTQGDTALILSITKPGSQHMVNLLLEQREIDLLAKNNLGKTCFIKAIEMLDFDIIKILLSQSEHRYRGLSGYNKCIVDAGLVAKKLGFLKIFNYMLKNILKKESALDAAVLNSDFKSLKFLLDYGWIKKKGRSRYDESYIMKALELYKDKKHSINESDIEIVKLFISVANDECDQYGENKILCLGVELGNSPLIKLLCQYVNKIYSGKRLSDIYYNGLETLLSNYKYEILQIFLENRPNLMSLCNTRDHLIVDALKGGAIEFVELFLNEHREINVFESLLITIKCCQLGCLNVIVEKFKVKTRLEISNKGSVFLHEAVKAGNKEIVERIISLGADVNAVYKDKSPLMHCSNNEIASLLLSHGALVTLKLGVGKLSALLNLFSRAQSHSFFSSYKKAQCYETTLELTKLYLNHGADIDDKDDDGRTALLLASSIENQARVITFLLESGADYSTFDNDGHNALYYAIIKGIKVNVEAFLKFQIDVNAQCSSDGMTALHLAAEYSNKDLLRLLVSHKADIGVVDLNGNTALMRAVKRNVYRSNKIDTILYLLDAGCDVNHRNKEGQTAIILAAEDSNTELVTLMSERGADLNIRSLVNRKNVTEIMIEKTVLSSSYFTKEQYTCTKNLLEKGGSAANVQQTCFFESISKNQFYLIQRIIFAGGSPTEISSSLIDRYAYKPSTMVSPFRYALIKEKFNLAKYFWDISFLTPSDCSYQQYTHCRMYLSEADRSKCTEFVDELYSKPMSLEKLSLITVSSLIGPGITREDNVKTLPIPNKFKDQLLFRTEGTLRTDTVCDTGDKLDVKHYISFLINRDIIYDSDSDESDNYGHYYFDHSYDSSDY